MIAARPAGPALFHDGFRVFFLAAALWAALAMAAWIAVLAGAAPLPSAFDPVTWHAHGLLFGYLGAVIAGFVLTAVPNWTGRPPLRGRALALLATAWAAGRVAVTVSAHLPWGLVMTADLVFFAALALFAGREIVLAGNRRNLVVVALIALLLIANGLFHLDARAGGHAASGAGARLGLGAALMLIALIGGRIVPAFTRNWLSRQDGAGRLPTPPMQRFDILALAVLAVALTLWILRPEAPLTGLALGLAALLHAARLARWAGGRTGAEPLVWVLHAGYAFLPLGAALQGAAILAPEMLGAGAAQHLWMAGAIGLMTLAVMTRATLGHCGQALSAGRATTALYLAVLAAVALRLGAGIAPGAAHILLTLSGLAWIAAFGGFAALYGPLLLRPRAP